MDDKKLILDFKRLLSEHPALLVSIVYFAASIIGMFYSWDFLRRFGINVFHYAQIGDFLLASLKEPFTWILVFLAIGLMVFDNAMSRRHQKKKREQVVSLVRQPNLPGQQLHGAPGNNWSVSLGFCGSNCNTGATGER